MKEIVIVTAWRRPDFLAATLERLKAADEGMQQFRIALDRRHDKRCVPVINDFIRALTPKRAKLIGRSHGYQGNSFNVLRSYQEAIKEGCNLVHLVEEDIFVADDYFAWHRAAHDLIPNAFSVSGARNQNFPNNPPSEPGAVYLHTAYQSVAVSFRPAILAPILKHATNAYFSNPVRYCQRMWPRTRIPVGNAEQDGLINRVAEAGGFRTVYPTEPVAYHAGFVGYHRKGESPLTVGKPVMAAARELLGMDAAELNRRAHSYPDHQWIDVHAKHTPPNRLVNWPVLP